MIGKVMNVVERIAGSALAEAASSGDGTITLVDIGDFSLDGGTLTVDAETIAYSSIDFTTNIVTLVGTLVGDYDEATPVSIYPEAVVRIAHVIPPPMPETVGS